jgi:hypothetical protein
MTLRFRAIAVAIVPAVLIAATPPARATMPPRHGPLPVVVSEALRGGLFEPPARRAPAEGAVGGAGGARAQLASQVLWRVPVILVSFADSALITTAAEFNQTLFDTTGSTATGSVYDY